MAYAIKEIFYSLQGEGANFGRPAVFCRFAGCNLWSGHEVDRHSAICRFCDTDFVGAGGPGGGRFDSAQQLAETVAHFWPGNGANRFAVLTGGEPMLQVDDALIASLHARGFEIAIETNGTLPVPPTIDWVCVSPKADADLVVTSGNELKLVFPQKGGNPSRYENLAFERFFLQPMDSAAKEENTRHAVAYCLANPRWRLSLQAHKLLGIR